MHWDTVIKAMDKQRTLRESIDYVGIGLHTGRRVSLRVYPGQPDTGIWFVRKDVGQGQGVIPALWHRVVETRMCTVLGNEHRITIATVEHLLAALRGCGIDNAVIEVDGPEIPIMDGSAEPWVELIDQAGMVTQTACRHAIRINKRVVVRDGDKYAALTPDDGSRYTVQIEFPGTAVGTQWLSVDMTPDCFRHVVARARTFGFSEDIAPLRRAGLIRGSSLKNVVLVDNNIVVNDDGLRYDDEFVRHKVLDAVGDLSLGGLPIMGHFHGHKNGHQINNALLKAVFRDQEAWSLEDVDENARTVWQKKLSWREQTEIPLEATLAG